MPLAVVVYRGGAGQLLANFFPFVSNIPDVFAEVNLAQFFFRQQRRGPAQTLKPS